MGTVDSFCYSRADQLFGAHETSKVSKHVLLKQAYCTDSHR